MKYSLSALLRVIPVTLNDLDTMEAKAIHMIGIPSSTLKIHTLFLQHKEASQCTICKRYCNDPPDSANSNTYTYKKYRATCEHNHLEVSLQARQHPNLEVYHQPFIFVGYKFWNSHRICTVGILSPKGLQQFEKAARYNPLKGN